MVYLMGSGLSIMLMEISMKDTGRTVITVAKGVTHSMIDEDRLETVKKIN